MDYKMRKQIVLVIFLLVALSSVLTAQSFKDPVVAEYLQLPTQESVYSKADVFIQADQSETRKKVGFGLGKLTGKSDEKGGSIEDLVNKVFADQIENYDPWNMFRGDIAAPAGDKKLQVVVVYTPDNSAKPMMAPMKNNDGLYTFDYRVKVKMKVYDEEKNLLIENDFNAVTGTGHSKTWSKGSKGSKSLFSVGKSDEEEKSDKDPYEEACIEGALQHCQRVVYGMYGMKEFKLPLGVAIIKKQKDSKDYFKIYNKIIEKKKTVLLSQSAQNKMQKCVDYWESIVDDTKDKYQWAVYSNLAVGYAWLLNEEKALANLQKVEELNGDIFETIAEKSGSFNHKDIEKLEMYNMIAPFVTYYAKGIKRNPEIPALLDINLHDMAHALAINNAMAFQFELPVTLPLFPYNSDNVNMDKCEGKIFKDEQKIAEFEYDMDDEELEEMEIEGEKDTRFDDMEQKFQIPKKKDLDIGEKKKFKHEFGKSSSAGAYSITPDVFVELRDYNYKFPYIWDPYAKISGDVKKEKTLSVGNYKAKLTDPGFIEKIIFTDECMNSEFYLDDSVHVTMAMGDYELKTTASNIDKNGYPKQYELTYNMSNTNFDVYVDINAGFFETTQSQLSRRIDYEYEYKEIVAEKLTQTLKASSAEFVEGEKPGRFKKVKLTKTYDCSYEVDDKGNWTEIKIGDFTVKRKIEY